jgi:hypothetical protein
VALHPRERQQQDTPAAAAAAAMDGGVHCDSLLACARRELVSTLFICDLGLDGITLK